MSGRRWALCDHLLYPALFSTPRFILAKGEGERPSTQDGYRLFWELPHKALSNRRKVPQVYGCHPALEKGTQGRTGGNGGECKTAGAVAPAVA
ncbi:MAG: hypothetical protein ACLRZU_08835 [Acutalibacteraceae bacterium]